MCKLNDWNNKELGGAFYPQEMQHVVKIDDVYKVNIISRERDSGTNNQY